MIRHPEIGELIPFRTGFEPLDSEWTWIAESDGEIRGVLVAAKFHSVLMLCRAIIAPDNPFVLSALVQQAFKEAQQRGIGRAMVFLGEGEAKIQALAMRHNARIIPVNGAWAACDLSEFTMRQAAEIN
jgi:hypothetical protein